MQNIVDIIIIIFILLCGVVGYKRGVFKQLVLCVGLILIFYLAYKFKDPVGEFFLLRFPIFDFPNLFKGVVTLNIIVYQTLAFVLVLAVLLLIFDFILSITGLFEKLLRITIILGSPSKILGFLLGLVEGYIVVFIALFFLHQPIVNVGILGESKFMDSILSSSPVLSNVVSNTNDVIDEVYILVDDYLNHKDVHKFNVKAIDSMLKYKIIDVDYMDKLIEKDKIKIPGITMVIDKYR